MEKNLKKRDNLQDLNLDEIRILNRTEGHGLTSFGLRKGQVAGYFYKAMDIPFLLNVGNFLTSSRTHIMVSRGTMFH